jgi:serine phosphatase RsbU (regulator of sigma subunit)/DNA-binding LacI/PurR family transcriptional regulator
MPLPRKIKRISKRRSRDPRGGKPEQSMSARASTKQKQTIGIILEGVENEFQSNNFKGAESAALQRNVRLICLSGACIRSESNPGLRQQKALLLKIVHSNVFDGLLIPNYLGSSSTTRQFRAFLSSLSPIPFVMLGRFDPAISSVDLDNVAGINSIMHHLVRTHGLRRFGFVQGSHQNPDAQQRYSSFLKCVQRWSLEVDDRWVFDGNFESYRVFDEVRERTRRFSPPQALVCANDNSALAAAKAFGEAGIEVPFDVAVTGFDGNMVSREAVPSITTVVQPWNRICLRALDMLLDQLSGHTGARFVKVKPSLLIQESCGCFSGHAGEKLLQAWSPSASNRMENSLRKGGMAQLERAFRAACAPSLPARERAPMQIAVTGFLTSLLSGSSPGAEGDIIAGFHRILTILHRAHVPLSGCHHALSLCDKWGNSSKGNRIKASILRQRILVCSQHLSGIQIRYHSSQNVNQFTSSYVISTLGSRFGGQSLADLSRELKATMPWIPLSACTIAAFDESALSRQRATVLYSNHEEFERKFNKPIKAISLLKAYLARYKSETSLIFDLLRSGYDPMGFQILTCPHDLLDLVTNQRHVIGQALKSILLVSQLARQTKELFDANTQLVRLRAEEERYLTAIKHELDLARKIQADFLPKDLPHFSGWEMAASFEPAEEVAGDFYDIFMLPDNRAGIVIADVSGKSVSAAIFMALVRSLLRILSDQALDDPLRVVGPINDYILRNHNRAGALMFVTLFFGVIDTTTGKLRYVNAGHPAPVIADGGHIRILEERSGPAVGINPSASYKVHETILAPGELLFAYTDGVTEAQNTQGMLLGKDKLFTAIDSSLMTPQTLIDSVRRVISEHRNGNRRSDDITMVALKRI